MSAASTRRTASAVEIRTFDAYSRTFTGYASTFGGPPDSYGDVIARGAFARTLKERAGKIVMLWQHDTTRPIGVWEELREDARGLLVCGRLVESTGGNDAYALLKAGALTGLSIGFRTVNSRLDPDGLTRVLTDIDLMEISVVSFPANDGARILDVRTAGSPWSSTLFALDRLEASLRGASLRFDAQTRELDARIAHLTKKPPATVAPAPSEQLSLAQRHADYRARMAHYQHYYQ